MKKIIISMMLLVAGMTTVFAADATIRAKVTMGAYDLVVREGADWSAAFDNGVDAYAYGAGGVVVSASGSRYESFATNDLEGAAIEFTPAAENVSFAFSYVIGDLYLVDKQANSRTKIVDGATYDFTVEASQVGVAQANRFALSKIGKPGPIFNNDKLTILGFAGKKVKVDDAKGGVVVAEKTLASDNEEINLSDKSAGRYVVTLDGKEYQIDVKVKDIPEAKYHIVTP